MVYIYSSNDCQSGKYALALMEALFTDEEIASSCNCVTKKEQEDFPANGEERYFEMHVVSHIIHMTSGCLYSRKRTQRGYYHGGLHIVYQDVDTG